MSMTAKWNLIPNEFVQVFWFSLMAKACRHHEIGYPKLSRQSARESEKQIFRMSVLNPFFSQRIEFIEQSQTTFNLPEAKTAIASKCFALNAFRDIDFFGVECYFKTLWPWCAKIVIWLLKPITKLRF